MHTIREEPTLDRLLMLHGHLTAALAIAGGFRGPWIQADEVEMLRQVSNDAAIAAVETIRPETLDAVRALHPSLHPAGVGHLLDRYRASHPKTRHVANWIDQVWDDWASIPPLESFANTEALVDWFSGRGQLRLRASAAR